MPGTARWRWRCLWRWWRVCEFEHNAICECNEIAANSYEGFDMSARARATAGPLPVRADQRLHRKITTPQRIASASTSEALAFGTNVERVNERIVRTNDGAIRIAAAQCHAIIMNPIGLRLGRDARQQGVAPAVARWHCLGDRRRAAEEYWTTRRPVLEGVPGGADLHGARWRTCHSHTETLTRVQA